MNLRTLRDELLDDPLGRGYSAMTDAQAADDLNNPRRAVQRDTVPSHEVFEAMVPAEWGALAAQEKQRVQTILSMGTVNIRGANTRASLAAAFGAGTATRTALAALQAGPGVSRAVELGLPKVGEHHVAQARAGKVE